MGCSHPGLDGAEGMFDRLAALAHLLRMLVEPALNGFENVLMFPSGDPSFLAGGASGLDCTAPADVGPVAAQHQSVFLGRVVVGELLASRTNVNVLVSHIAEVLLAEASFGLCVRGHRLWQRNRDTSLLACPNLFAVEVTAVGDGIELLHAQRRLGLVGHMGELRSVSSVVGYLMHNDQWPRRQSERCSRRRRNRGRWWPSSGHRDRSAISAGPGWQASPP